MCWKGMQGSNEVNRPTPPAPKPSNSKSRPVSPKNLSASALANNKPSLKSRSVLPKPGTLLAPLPPPHP